MNKDTELSEDRERIPRASRESYWSEMTDERKIEKLINELTRTQHALSKLSEYVTKLIKHDHQEGRLITIIEHPDNVSYGGFYFRVYDKK